MLSCSFSLALLRAAAASGGPNGQYGQLPPAWIVP
jgi:hypothetical protein